MEPKRRIISFLLAICLLVGLMPTAAFAAGTDTGKAIQLVDHGIAANIIGGQTSSIYFGTYQQSSNESGGYNVDPIKWRVLSNADGKLFLLSDQNLDVFEYHKENESVTWETSTMRSWLNGLNENKGSGDSAIDYADDNFLDHAFSAKEQTAIADTEVVNDDNPDYQTEGGNNTTDKIFLLSIAEARNNAYFADENSRIATNTSYVAGGGEIGTSGMDPAGGWLRSPGEIASNAAHVYYDGGVNSIGYYVYDVSNAVRPAFNLHLNSVLFTSAAEGGKSASGMDSGLAEVGTAGAEWKLTLLDSGRSFSVTESSLAAEPGGTVEITYSGAETSSNEYVSAMIVDGEGAVLYYGRIVNNSTSGTASGTASVTIPSGLTSGSYTLKVFSEQYNGDKMTDYASAFVDIALTVSGAPVTYTVTVQSDGNGTASADPATAAQGTEITLTATPNSGYHFKEWQVISGSVTITDNKFTMPDNDVTVKAVFETDTPPVSPVYSISADTTTLDFGSVQTGYATLAAQTITITNTGNQQITLTQPTAGNYTIGELSKADLATGETATFTIQPKDNLTAGTYNEAITVKGANGGNSTNEVSISANFTVQSGSGGINPDPHSHTGGTATCTMKAICEICGNEYGEFNLNNHDWSEWTDAGDDVNHMRTCQREGCGAIQTEAHDCTKWLFCGYQRRCDVCNADYGDIVEHDMYYEDRGENGHKPYCRRCDTLFFLEPHIPDCMGKCEICRAACGVTDPDNHDWGEWADDGGGVNHMRTCQRENCDATQTETHADGTATCQSPAICSGCGQAYGSKDENNHTGGTEIRGYVAPTATKAGYTGDTYCKGCGL